MKEVVNEMFFPIFLCFGVNKTLMLLKRKRSQSSNQVTSCKVSFTIVSWWDYVFIAGNSYFLRVTSRLQASYSWSSATEAQCHFVSSECRRMAFLCGYRHLTNISLFLSHTVVCRLFITLATHSWQNIPPFISAGKVRSR